MPPGISIKEFDLAAYTPAGSRAIVGVIGPATKGPINALGEFTDEGNFVSAHGRPVNYQYAVRGAIRYLRFGNQLKFVRVAGTLLKTAFVEQWKSVGGIDIPIIRIEGISAGTWANGTVKINITHNGDPASSYNIMVYFMDQIVERFDNLTNGTVETEVNRESTYIQVALHRDAGLVFPNETLDSETEVLVPMSLASGDDGSFASSKSPESTTGGVSAASVWNYMMAVNTTANYSGNEDRPIVPGSISITDGVETFTDNKDGTLTGGGGGSGVINYQTGAWSVAFNVVPIAAVTVNYQRATYEVLKTASQYETNYSGNVSRNGVAPGSLMIFDPRDDQVDLGDGATDTYNPTIGADVVQGSVEITTKDILGNEMSAVDDGSGALTGNLVVPGTITYATGVLNFQFSSDVKNGEPIMIKYRVYVVDNGAGILAGANVAGTIQYKTGAWTLIHTFIPAGNYIPKNEDGGAFDAFFKHATVLDYGDAIEVTFEGTLQEYPIKPGSVEIYYATSPTAPLVDDGIGGISGAGGSGTIDYVTGEYSVTFIGAPAMGFPVRAEYHSILLHFASIYAGPTGNESDPIADGIFVWVDKSPNTPVVNLGDQWYRVRVMFNDGSGVGSLAVETFDNLRTVAELLSTVNDTDNGSEYVHVEETGYHGEINTAYDTGNGQKIGMAGAFTTADVIGAHVGPTYSGMQLFSNSELIPLHFLSAPGMYHRQVQNAGISLCEGRRCVWILSVPDFESTYDARDFVNGEYNAPSPGALPRPKPHIPYPFLSAVDSSSAFCSFSWLLYEDAYSGEEVWEPGEGDILGLIGKIDNEYEPWFPIAGIRRGQLSNLSSVRHSPDVGERAATYGRSGTRIEVLNPFVDFVGQGIFLYGQRTMARDPKATDRLHVRWTANLIANTILLRGRTYPHEQNDEILWREIRAMLNSTLNPIKAKRGITDYRIVCDATTNTPAVISSKKVVAKLFIKFVEVAEEIEFQMIFTPTTASFDEVAPLG